MFSKKLILLYILAFIVGYNVSFRQNICECSKDMRTDMYIGKVCLSCWFP